MAGSQTDLLGKLLQALQDKQDVKEPELQQFLDAVRKNKGFVEDAAAEASAQAQADADAALSAVGKDPLSFGNVGQPGIATKGSILKLIPSRITGRGKLI